MTPTEQAARWLADVPRLWLGAENSDHECEVWFDPDEGGTEYVQTDAVLAAIARHIAPGDDLVERVAAAQAAFAHPFRPTMGPVAAGKLIDDLAVRISALTATVAEQDALDAAWCERVAAITAEAAALRDRLARMEGALILIAELTENRSIKRLARAALADGGSNG